MTKKQFFMQALTGEFRCSTKSDCDDLLHLLYEHGYINKDVWKDVKHQISFIQDGDGNVLQQNAMTKHSSVIVKMLKPFQVVKAANAKEVLAIDASKVSTDEMLIVFVSLPDAA